MNYGLIALRISMAIAVVGAIWGAFWGYRDERRLGGFYGLGGAIAGFICGFFVVVALELMVFLVARAFLFVFTGE